MPLFLSNGPANQRPAGCDEPPTYLKVMVGARNGNKCQGGKRSREMGLDDGERAPPGGSAEEARAAATGGLDYCERVPPGGSDEEARAATGGLDDGERAPPGGSAEEARAAATGGLDYCELAPPGGSDEARAATMVVRDDGELSARSREQDAKAGARRIGHRYSGDQDGGRERRLERISW